MESGKNKEKEISCRGGGEGGDGGHVDRFCVWEGNNIQRGGWRVGGMEENNTHAHLHKHCRRGRARTQTL